MKVTRGDGDFFRVEGAPKAISDYIKWSITPIMYRYYDEGCWFVHKDFIDDVRQLDKGKSVMPFSTDPYGVLYLTVGAPRYILEAVWKAIVKKCHPDKGGDTDKFLEYKEAYEEIKRDG